MKFIQLTMEYFRSYAPKVEIKFQNKNNKPLSIFTGENGAGKTSIYLAIVWALYGEDAILRFAETRKKDEQAPKNNFDLVNKDSIANGSGFMRVSLVFEHDSEKYYLFRTVRSRTPSPKKNGDLTEDLTLRRGASAKDENYPQGLVNDILPLDASQFFFFDGEDVRKYSGATSDDTEEAIERVLGIPEIREARVDVQKLDRKLLNQMGEEEAISDELRKVTQLLATAKDEYEGFTKTLNARRKELEKLNSELIHMEAKRESIKEIAELNANLKSLRTESDTTKRSYDELVEQRDALVKNLPFFLVAPKVREILDRFKKTAGTDDLSRQINALTSKVSLVDELLNESVKQCYCGTDLDSSHRSHLRHFKSSFEKQLLELREKSSRKTTPSIEEIQYVLGRIESINLDFGKYEQRINVLKLKLLELDDKVRETEAKIKGSNVKEAESIQDLIEKSRRKQGSLESEIRNLEGIVGEKGSLCQKLESSLGKNQLKQGKFSTISACHSLAEKLSSALDWIVDEMYAQKKDIIVENASRFFLNVAPKEGYKGINIEDNYSIWLLDKNGMREKPSEGYKELVALSFIYGLNKAASYNAPVVMDFVLGRLDSYRQLAVATNFRDFAEQIILLLLDTELMAEGVNTKLDSMAAQKCLISRNLKNGRSSVEVTN